MKDGNIDQNDGQQVIGSDIPREVCLQRCYAHENAHGCEWHALRSCSVHKQNVVRGNGNIEYICWTFKRQGIVKNRSIFLFYVLKFYVHLILIKADYLLIDGPKNENIANIQSNTECNMCCTIKDSVTVWPAKQIHIT